VALSKKGRGIFAAFGTVVLLFAVGAFAQGHIYYQNWWRGNVFAPFAVIVGLLSLSIALFGRRKNEL
jgi:fumarate reductase subunit C